MARPKKTTKTDKKGARGRPSDFKQEYCEQGYKYCLLGATDKQLAHLFDKAESTIHKWKLDYPQFSEALKAGKEEADSKVAQSLYHRAMGYSHTEEKLFQNGGKVVRAKTVKHYPPDTVACIFWLKNRDKENWRDKHDVEHSGEVRGVLEVPTPIEPEQWVNAAKRHQNRLTH